MSLLVPKNTYSYDNNFDILRLIFAFLVLIYHTSFLYGENLSFFLFNMPDIAVKAFFIISGILIMWSFDNNNDIKSYTIKRFFRIYPLYFVLITIQTLILFLLNNIDHLSKLISELSYYFIANIFYLNFLQPSIDGVFNHLRINAINGSLWTLKLEVLFYFTLPFIYFAYKKWDKNILIFLYLLSSLYIFIGIYFDFPFLEKLFPGQLRYFIVGILLYLYGHKLKNNITTSLLMLFALFMINIFAKNNIYNVLIQPVVLGLIVYYLAYFKINIKLKHDLSYGLYVIHFPIIQLMLYFNIFTNNFYLFLTIVILIVFILSYSSSVLLEEKCINLGKSIVKFNIANKDNITNTQTRDKIA